MMLSLVILILSLSKDELEMVTDWNTSFDGLRMRTVNWRARIA
jgi:hypothetical protein